MPYRVVEYSPAHGHHHHQSGRRPFASRGPHATVHYAGRSYGRMIPRVAHSRVVSVPPPSRYVRSQDIYSLGEESYRLPYKSRVVYIEDVSKYGSDYKESSYDLQEYDAEMESRRRDASDALLRLAYGAPVPLFSYRNMPLRSASEMRDVADVRRNFVRERNSMSPGPMSRIQSEIYRMAMYQEPIRKPLSGKGNLACLSFAGGRPISRRQLRYFPEDNAIRDEFNFRSFYNNLRVAATLSTFYKRPVMYQPLFKSKKSLMGIKGDTEEKPRKAATESKWVTRGGGYDEEKERPKREVAKPRPEIQQSYTLPGPRKSIIEFPQEVEKLVENEPEVVVSLSRKSIQEDYPPIIPEAKETIKIQPHKVEEETKESEPEEEFVDAEESKPISSPSPIPPEETFEEAQQDPEPVPEPEPEEVKAAPEPPVEPEPVIEPEPELTVEPEPELTVEPEPEPVAEEIVESKHEEEVSSPAPHPPEAEEEEEHKETPMDDQIVANGTTDVKSGDEEEEHVDATSPLPPSEKVLSEEEQEEEPVREKLEESEPPEEEVVPEDKALSQNGECEDEEIKDEPTSPVPPASTTEDEEENEGILTPKPEEVDRKPTSDEELGSECEESE